MQGDHTSQHIETGPRDSDAATLRSRVSKLTAMQDGTSRPPAWWAVVPSGRIPRQQQQVSTCKRIVSPSSKQTRVLFGSSYPEAAYMRQCQEVATDSTAGKLTSTEADSPVDHIQPLITSSFFCQALRNTSALPACPCQQPSNASASRDEPLTSWHPMAPAEGPSQSDAIANTSNHTKVVPCLSQPTPSAQQARFSMNPPSKFSRKTADFKVRPAESIPFYRSSAQAVCLCTTCAPRAGAA